MGGTCAAKRTVDLPYSYHTLECAGEGRRRSFTCPISPLLLLLRLWRLARPPVGNPRGGAIKKNLRAVLSLPPPHFFTPLPSFHMKYRADFHSFDIPANKAMAVQPRPKRKKKRKARRMGEKKKSCNIA